MRCYKNKKIIIYVYLLLAVSLVTGTIECVDDECASDPIKNELLSWYDRWMKGFEVDYITPTDLRDSYDFIVVGAGIGGSIVAHRLAMDPSYPSVLLLEAGAKHNTSGLSKEMVPALVLENQLSDIDWQYISEPSDGYCCQWNCENRLTMARGKVTGGSSVLNYMAWLRGHKQDWDVLFNITDWKWNDVLHYFKKTESVHHSNKQYKDTSARGYNGPIIINDARNLMDKNSIVEESLINAFVATKQFDFLEHGQNSNSGSNIGIAFTEFNIDDTGHRNNAFLGYNKYLRRTYSKEYADGLIKLDILPKAYVTQILFDEKLKTDDGLLRTKGVKFIDLGDEKVYSRFQKHRKKIYKVYLTNNNKSEVILCGGSINNPQLLMLSGLGPKEELKKHNIEIIQDIPGVGNNLQDHTMFWMRYHYDSDYFSEATTTHKMEKTLTNFTLFKDYLFERNSLLSTSGLNINGFLRSNVMNTRDGTSNTYPDLQFYVTSGFPVVEKFFHREDKVWIDHECGDVQFYSDKANMMNIVAVVGLQHPESRGWVKLKTNNPLDHPLIQPNYLKEQVDVNALIEGYKIMHKVMQQPSAKKLWDKRMNCKTYGDIDNNDTNLEQYIRDSIFHIFHPVGTCKMGDIDNDEMAVIDNKLLVRGTSNLRIVDASIYPHQTSGNTQAPTYMIGEKGSDIILKIWNSK